MVKTTGPLMSVDAKGTLANVLTYQGGFGGHRVTRKPDHRDALSDAQRDHRGLFQAARDIWRPLVASKKAEFNDLGDPLKMTGYNYWLREYLKTVSYDGLVLNVPMQEGSGMIAHDRSRFGNDGSIVGASWVQLASGLWALSFDGGDDYVNCGYAESLQVVDEVTLEAWIKPSVAADLRAIAGRYYRRPMLWLNTDDKLRYGYTRSDGKNEYIISDLGVTEGIWQQVAVTHKYSTGAINFYLNEMQDSKIAAFIGAPLVGTWVFTIGSRWTDGGDSFAGPMCLVCGSNRVKSADEIRSDYILLAPFFA